MDPDIEWYYAQVIAELSGDAEFERQEREANRCCGDRIIAAYRLCGCGGA